MSELLLLPADLLLMILEYLELDLRSWLQWIQCSWYCWELGTNDWLWIQWNRRFVISIPWRSIPKLTDPRLCFRAKLAASYTILTDSASLRVTVHGTGRCEFTGYERSGTLISMAHSKQNYQHYRELYDSKRLPRIIYAAATTKSKTLLMLSETGIIYDRYQFTDEWDDDQMICRVFKQKPYRCAATGMGRFAWTRNNIIYYWDRVIGLDNNVRNCKPIRVNSVYRIPEEPTITDICAPDGIATEEFRANPFITIIMKQFKVDLPMLPIYNEMIKANYTQAERDQFAAVVQ